MVRKVMPAEVRALWLRFWPGRYPRTRVDIGLAVGRVFAAAFAVRSGWVIGPLVFHSGPQWWAVVGWHFAGAGLGLLIVTVVDLAAWAQGQRVGRWEAEEQARLRRDALLQNTRRPGRRNERAPRVMSSPAPPGGWFRSATPEPGQGETGTGGPGGDSPALEEDMLKELICKIAGSPENSSGVGRTAIRDALTARGHPLSAVQVQNYVWQLAWLERRLAYDRNASTFRAVPAPGGDDPWPGLGQVLVQFCRGGDPETVTTLLNLLGRYGAHIPKDRVVQALDVEVENGRLIEQHSGYSAAPSTTVA